MSEKVIRKQSKSEKEILPRINGGVIFENLELRYTIRKDQEHFCQPAALDIIKKNMKLKFALKLHVNHPVLWKRGRKTYLITSMQRLADAQIAIVQLFSS